MHEEPIITLLIQSGWKAQGEAIRSVTEVCGHRFAIIVTDQTVYQAEPSYDSLKVIIKVIARLPV